MQAAPHLRGKSGSRVLVVSSKELSPAFRQAAAAAELTVEAANPPDLAACVKRFRPHVTLVELPLLEKLARDALQELHTAGSQLIAVVDAVSGEVVTRAARTDADTLVEEPLDVLPVKRLLSRGGRSERPHFNLPLAVSMSAEMQEVWRTVLLAADSNSSLLIRGETGVGKEIVARAVHRFSIRSAAPFVAVNCAAVPETLLESELFGHEKGAFTGAISRHPGKFEVANGGTLFLDEIGDLSPALQAKLLRVLQERTFERVGGHEPISVDVHVISATNCELTAAGSGFRSDLFYRLNVLSVEIPPLRQRKRDILPIWEQVITELAERAGIPVPETNSDVQKLLTSYSWPGNVRELQSTAERALAITRSGEISRHELPRALQKEEGEPPLQPNLAGMKLKDVERLLITQTYEALGSIKATATAIGISTRKVHYRLKEYRAEEFERTGTSGEPSQNHRLLLAEDDEDLRMALTDFLRDEGYEVISLASGRAVLEYLGRSMLMQQKEGPPDLIVTDLRMPGMTGLQLLQGVRTCGWDTPVVVMSAFADAETKKQAAALGATEFLEKPIDTTQLQDVIRTALQQR